MRISKFRVVLVAACLAVSAVGMSAPASMAAETPAPSGNPITIAGVGTATQLRPEYPVAWVRFRPSLNSEHLEVHRGHDIATICWYIKDGRSWDLIYDHNSHRVGYTYSEYLTVSANQWCGNVGRKTGGAALEVWVHLYPRSDWAHESIWPGHDIARICQIPEWYQDPTDPQYPHPRRWDLFIDHDNEVAGFTWFHYIGGAEDVQTCD